MHFLIQLEELLKQPPQSPSKAEEWLSAYHHFLCSFLEYKTWLELDVLHNMHDPYFQQKKRTFESQIAQPIYNKTGLLMSIYLNALVQTPKKPHYEYLIKKIKNQKSILFSKRGNIHYKMCLQK
jgi:hypothetical protein